jgi:asparagine N-glycosylation enzyme membrane subunit Stt3
VHPQLRHFDPIFGFYWDDLPILFQYKTFGAAGFPAFLASDRPFSAWIFMLTTSLFHFNPLGYHLMAFVLRFLSVVLFYQIFRTVWPEKTQTAAIAASIFAIYPGFHQQPIALIYCHHFSVFCLFLLSVWLMLKNAQREKINWAWAIISWLATFGMFSIENFATLEMIRPVLLWFIFFPIYHTFKDTLKAVVKTWLPYLAIFCSFMIWRVFIFKFPTYEPDLLEGVNSSPTSTSQPCWHAFQKISTP